MSKKQLLSDIKIEDFWREFYAEGFCIDEDESGCQPFYIDEMGIVNVSGDDVMECKFSDNDILYPPAEFIFGFITSNVHNRYNSN